MGWSSVITEKRTLTSSDRKSICDNLFLEHAIVKSQQVGNIWYGAIKTKQEIVGVVIITRFRDYELFYKIICETDLPYYTTCPRSIISILSPTTDENANAWRKHCLDYNNNQTKKRNLAIGSIIKFTDAKGTRYAIKREPNRQFKSTWWELIGYGNNYYPKKYIPDDFEVITLEQLKQELNNK